MISELICQYIPDFDNQNNLVTIGKLKLLAASREESSIPNWYFFIFLLANPAAEQRGMRSREFRSLKTITSLPLPDLHRDRLLQTRGIRNIIPLEV
jgi:hypothetical protein